MKSCAGVWWPQCSLRLHNIKEESMSRVKSDHHCQIHAAATSFSSHSSGCCFFFVLPPLPLRHQSSHGCGFNALFAVAPLFPSNLFITCGGLGNQIAQQLRAMCVTRCPLSPELPHKSPTWSLLRVVVMFTLAAVYGFSCYCQP